MKIHTLLITTFAIASLSAQDKPSSKEAAGEEIPEAPANLSVCYEDFSLPLAMAAALQREHLSGGALYTKLLAAVGKDGVRQETFALVRGKSGQKSTTENISEDIYPAEYQPGQVSDAVTTSAPGISPDAKPQGAAADGPVGLARVPATPTAFETRNAGFTLEVEPTLSEDGLIADLRLVPEHITLVGQSTAGMEFSTTEMPIFETQRMNLSVTVRINEPYLLGTVNRPPGSKQDQDGGARVWFAFATVKAPKS